MRYVILLLAAVLSFAAESTPAPVYEEVVIEGDQIRVAISTLRASVRRVELIHSARIDLPSHLLVQSGQVPEGPLPVLRPFMQAGNHNWMLASPGVFGPEPWRVENRSANAVTLRYDSANGLAWTVAYRIPNGSLAVQVAVDVTNRGQAPTELDFKVIPLTGIHTDWGPGEVTYQTVFSHQGGTKGGITNHGLAPIPVAGAPLNDPVLGGGAAGTDYVGLKSRFFAAWWSPLASAKTPVEAAPEAAKPMGMDGLVQSTAAGVAAPTTDWVASAQGFNGSNGVHQSFILVSYPLTTLQPGQTWNRAWSISVASMTKADLARVSETEQAVKYTDGFYRFFKILANALTWVLDLLAGVVHQYGVAVILLTILIKAALYRTTYKQQESMLKMQKVGPELKYLQEQYKNNKQMLAQKQMELFKKHGVNPLGGCLPIFIQLPIFIALFQAFSHSADLRGTSFLWISDLTLPDQVWGTPIAFLDGWMLSLNPLPIIYIGVSAWMSFSQTPPANSDPQQEMMYKMMRWMPVVFGVIFYNMPSGLVLYFTVQAVISTLEIKYIKRKLGM